MPAPDDGLLRAAQDRMPSDDGIRACWDFVVEGLKVGWLNRARLQELIGYLRRHEHYGLDELLFEEIGDNLRASFLSDSAECSPAAMIDELEALLSAGSASRRVSVVEFRSFDGEREKVRDRLVLTSDGTVVTVAPIEPYRRVVDKDLELGVPGPGKTYVKRDAGLAFLTLLAPNFRGSTYYATKVFEMEEPDAMTPPLYEPPPKLPLE
jgi:hypothetical protein